MIWPPYLDHFVEPSQTDEERISISFDIMAEMINLFSQPIYVDRV